MTKAQYIDFIRNIVDPSGRNPRFLPKQIEYAIDMVYSQYTMSLNPDQYENVDFLTKEYVTQTVLEDPTTGHFYTDLPAPVVPMRIPSEAVRYISSNEGVSLDYCPMTELTWQLRDGLFSHDIDTTIGYVVRYNKVFYDDNMTDAIAEDGVRMVIAVPFSSFEYEEHVNLTIGGIDLVQQVVQMLMNTQPIDLKNDNK